MIIPLKESDQFPRLVFDNDVHEHDLAPLGYRGDVSVEFPNGETFPVFFMEHRAVLEELAARSKDGFAQFVTEPGLVIVQHITVAVMKSVVLDLIQIGHFDQFKPLPPAAANNTDKPNG